MNYRITDLLDGLEEAGQPVTPRGGNAARVKAKTLARLNAAEAPVRSAWPARRRFRPAALLAAALAAVLLLSGSAFAAWKLGAFRFADEFGSQGEILDSYAQTYEPINPTSDEIVSAQWRPAEREADYVPQREFTTAAETKDFRFSLRSLTANASMIYAVIDVEGITDWGRAHLDTIPELAVWNHSRQNSGTLIDARLVGSEENLRRYLVGHSGSRQLNEAGDDITFECLELFEEDYPEGHSVYLFDVKLETLVPDAATLSTPEGEPAGSITWRSVSVDAMGLTVEGLEGESRYEAGCPTVVLVFRDGTQETVLDETWQPYSPRSEHDVAMESFTGWHDGTAHLSLTFSQAIDPASLAAVVVDGQTFSLDN